MWGEGMELTVRTRHMLRLPALRTSDDAVLDLYASQLAYRSPET